MKGVRHNLKNLRDLSNLLGGREGRFSGYTFTDTNYVDRGHDFFLNIPQNERRWNKKT